MTTQKNRADTEQMKSFIQNPKALIVAPPWAGLIVTGEKDWEMRSRPTSLRGTIAIAEKGAKRLLGLATLARCSGPHTQTALLQNMSHHRGTENDIMQPGFRHHYAWELSNAIEFPAPIPYAPKSGAVSWVNLTPDVVQKILHVLNSDIPAQHTDKTTKAATPTISRPTPTPTPTPTPAIVQPQSTPATPQTEFSSNDYVGTMVPKAKDGSVFHPHHCQRNGKYRVGEKGAIKTFGDFAEALKYLTEMKTATWLRPNPKGNWGGVKAVEWIPLINPE